MKYKYDVIGKRIKTERKKLNLKQENTKGDEDGKQALVDILREEYTIPISRNTISSLENGHPVTLKADFLFALCDIFGCELGYLLGEEGYEFPTGRTTDIVRETGLSQNSIDTLQKHKDKQIIRTIDLLLSHLDFRSDLLTMLTEYLFRPDGSNPGDICFQGENGEDISLSGEVLTNGGLVAAITSLLIGYRADIQKAGNDQKSR